MKNSNKVVLVGRASASHENLSLQYLEGALANAGIPVQVLGISGFNELTAITNQIMARPPAVVGLSITDATCAVLLPGLGEALHRRGYAGHITCGGGWATLQRHWLLERYPWLDSVVRFDGEVVLPRLVTAVTQNGTLSTIGGVTTRTGDGHPAPMHSSVPMTTRPARGALPTMLHHHATSMISSRGCMGSCDYCGPAALQQLERAEAKRIRAAYPCNNGRVRRRTVDDITAEMASLYHERDVRYFVFADEHLLPFSENAALAFLSEFRGQLEQKKVAAFGFSGQISANQVTPALCDTLADAGLVRAHLGIDLIDNSRTFSRNGHVAKQFAAVQQMNAAGIPTISNVLLLHPYASFESMKRTLLQLQQLDVGYVEFAQMQAFAGTTMTERLRTEGRLEGNPLRYLYTFEDPRLARFEQLFTLLRAQGFDHFSIMYRLHEMASRLAFARRMGHRLSHRFDEVLERYRRAAFRMALQAYSHAIQICECAQSVNQREFLNAYRMGRTVLARNLEKLECDFNEQIQLIPVASSSFTTNAVSLMALLLFAGATACHEMQEITVDTDSHAVTDADADSDADGDADGDSDGDADGDIDGDADGDSDGDADGDSDGDADADGDADTNLDTCEFGTSEDETSKQKIITTVKNIDPCATGTLNHYAGSRSYKEKTELWWGGTSRGEVIYRWSSVQDDEDFYYQVMSILADADIACLPNYTDIEGERSEQAALLAETARTACDGPLEDFGDGVLATVNQHGQATLSESLLEDNTLTQEEYACINEVLADLDFSCLADNDVSADTYPLVIIE